jgi:hypothetical protein
MLCVIFNSAGTAGAGPLMGARLRNTAQEEKRSPTRTTVRNPNVRSFTIGIFDNSLKRIQREDALLAGEHPIQSHLLLTYL